MTQKTIKIFIDEIYSKLPKKIFATNKTNIYYINNIMVVKIMVQVIIEDTDVTDMF